jgi:hypothetical protein
MQQERGQIIFELEETVVVKQGGKIATDLCPKCGANVKMVSPDILALVSGSMEREIFRLIEAGRIHFIEDGRTLACVSCYRRSLIGDRDGADEKLPVIDEGR